MQNRVNRILRIPLFFALFVLLGLIFGFLTFKILSFSRTVEVPSLTNTSLLEANEVMSRSGLYVKVEGEDYDPVVAAGRIIRQDIPAGNKVKEKRSIKVVISKGPKVYSVPSVVGEALADAESLMLQKGLRITRVVQVRSDTAEKGKVIAQKPEPEDRVGDSLTVLVSSGPHAVLYYCPDFVNKSLEGAQELAVKLGLKIETKGSGSIIRSQKPKPGTVVKSGEPIIIELREERPNDQHSPVNPVS